MGQRRRARQPLRRLAITTARRWDKAMEKKASGHCIRADALLHDGFDGRVRRRIGRALLRAGRTPPAGH